MEQLADSLTYMNYNSVTLGEYYVYEPTIKHNLRYSSSSSWLHNHIEIFSTAPFPMGVEELVVYNIERV